MYWWGWQWDVWKRVVIHVELVEVVVVVVGRHIERTLLVGCDVAVVGDVMWRLRKLMKVAVVRGRW